MIFFEVPTAAALAEAEENKDKVIRKPNRFYVHAHTTHMTLNANPSTLKQFPVVHIQAGKSVHVDIWVPAYTSSLGGVCINTSVKVNGQTWYNLGNCGYTGDKMSNGVRTKGGVRQTMVLDLVSGLGLDPLADYNLQFYVTGRTYAGNGWVNQYSVVNNTDAGGKGSRNATMTNQNYMRLIVQEMD